MFESPEALFSTPMVNYFVTLWGKFYQQQALSLVENQAYSAVNRCYGEQPLMTALQRTALRE